VVIPKLLEAGLLRSFSKQHGDLVPVLTSLFDFDDATGKWNLREDALPDGSKDADLARYHIARFLSRSHREGAPAAETEIRQYLSRAFKHNGLPSDKTFKRLLHEVGTCSDGSHWLPKNNCSQGELF